MMLCCSAAVPPAGILNSTSMFGISLAAFSCDGPELGWIIRHESELMLRSWTAGRIGARWRRLAGSKQQRD